MKIRNDFVTNSSSSSFIVGYNDFQGFCKNISEKLSPYKDIAPYLLLIYDVFDKCNEIDIDDACERMREYLKWDIKYDMSIAYPNMSESKLEKKVEEKLSQVMEELINKMKEYKHLSYVTYGSEVDRNIENFFEMSYELENHLIEELPNCIEKINNH